MRERGQASYPAQPWRLRGQMVVSVWLVPKDSLPALPLGLAGAVRPVTILGRAVVGTAWVDYQPGGDLTYRELLAAVLVHARGRPRVSITDIWVDSAASRAGGRELWGIPKQLATLDFAGADARAWSAGAEGGTGVGTIARARLSVRRRTLGRWPLRMSVTQSRAGRANTTSVRGTAGLARASAAWHVPPTGPLGWLAGRRPWFSVALRDFRITFGK